MNKPRGNLTLLSLNIEEPSKMVYTETTSNLRNVQLFFQQPPQLFHVTGFDGTTAWEPIERKYHFSVLLIEAWSSVISSEPDIW